MRILATLFLVGLVALVGGKSSSQYYCGDKIWRALASICPYTGDEKRSGSWGEFHRNDIGSHDKDSRAMAFDERGAEAYYDGAEGWWLDRPRALTVRAKKGVVDECCFKPCKLDTLLSYCV